MMPFHSTVRSTQHLRYLPNLPKRFQAMEHSVKFLATGRCTVGCTHVKNFFTLGINTVFVRCRSPSLIRDVDILARRNAVLTRPKSCVSIRFHLYLKAAAI